MKDKSFKLYIWRDGNDFENEFLSYVKPWEWRPGTYHVGGQDMIDLRGNPLGLKKGEVFEVTLRKIKKTRASSS